VVRSTATGKVTATVPAPRVPNAPGYGLIGSARNGTFFVVSFVRGARGERIYRFRVTAVGRVSGFSAVPGGVLGGAEWSADALAASPDGRLVAVAFSFIGPAGARRCGGAGQPACPRGGPSDYIIVVNTATGAKSVFRGELKAPGRTSASAACPGPTAGVSWSSWASGAM